MLIKALVKLYFYGSNRREKREETGFGIIAFAIPDIGFIFRSAHKGTALDCECFALLILCQFVEANAGLFKEQKLEFLGDSTTVVYHLSRPASSFQLAPQSLQSSLLVGDSASGKTSVHLLARLWAFKKKLGFSLLWVPLAENRATDEAARHPTAKNSPLQEQLNTSFLGAFKSKKNPSPGLSSL